MKILFDQGTPFPLRHRLVGHEVTTVFELGWSRLQNGELLAAAEGKFDALITTDQSIQYQQNLTGRTIAIIVLSTTRWPTIDAQSRKVVSAIADLKPGDYREIDFST